MARDAADGGRLALGTVASVAPDHPLLLPRTCSRPRLPTYISRPSTRSREDLSIGVIPLPRHIVCDDVVVLSRRRPSIPLQQPWRLQVKTPSSSACSASRSTTTSTVPHPCTNTRDKPPLTRCRTNTLYQPPRDPHRLHHLLSRKPPFLDFLFNLHSLTPPGGVMALRLLSSLCAPPRRAHARLR